MQINKPLKNQQLFAKTVELFIYVLFIIVITVLSRQSGFFYSINQTPFWSYLEWIKGDSQLGLEIILNICLFVPAGFLASSLFGIEKKKKLLIILGGFCLSFLIETIQYKYKLGLAEFDDIFNNTLGTLFGVFLFEICNNRIKQKHFLDIVASCFVVIGLIFAIRATLMTQCLGVTEFAFQIECVGEGQISGYAFPYGEDAGTLDYSIILKDTETNECVTLQTQTGIERQDVNQYFNSEYDYMKSGFTATYDDIPKSSEVLIDWKDVGIWETGIYVVNNKVQCTAESIPSYDGTDLQNMTESGRLLAHNARFSCDVYQIGKSYTGLWAQNLILKMMARHIFNTNCGLQKQMLCRKVANSMDLII